LLPARPSFLSAFATEGPAKTEKIVTLVLLPLIVPFEVTGAAVLLKENFC
jgi:hypothetical protein